MTRRSLNALRAAHLGPVPLHGLSLVPGLDCTATPNLTGTLHWQSPRGACWNLKPR